MRVPQRSLGRSCQPMEWRDRIRSRFSCGSTRLAGESVYEGLMQLTLMLYLPHSAARRLVSMTTPALAVQYATLALAMLADIEAILMILPRPFAIIALAAALPAR